MKDQNVMTKEFFDYHKLNAESGSIHSMFVLALNYLRGDVTSPDYDLAFYYFRKILIDKNYLD